MFWTCFAIFSCLLAYYGQDKFPERLRYFSRALLVILLAYVVAFYCPVAQDHLVYANRYINGYYDYYFSMQMDIRERFEIGYTFINKLAKMLHLGVPGFLFLIGLIANSLLINLMYKFPHPVISVATLIVSAVFFQEMNLVRQSVAIGFVLLSISFIDKRNILGFIVCIIVATSFHFSALLCSPLWFLTLLKDERSHNIFQKVLLCIWIFSLPVAIGLYKIDMPLINFLLQDSVYSGYVDDLSYNSVGTKIGINYVYNLMVLLSIGIKDEKYNNYLSVFIIGIILLNFSQSIPNLYRFALYFSSSHFAVYSLLITNNAYLSKSVANSVRYAYIAYVFGYCLIFSNILSGNSVVGSICYEISDFFVK